ncbi:MAG: Fe-S-binding domain-containing protein, partial [Anaerolineales bacterium]|nr:Fe-S-binding domain-containing protein [Anaerolineales bacterium]
MEFLLQPLTILTFLPLAGVLVLAFIDPGRKNVIRLIALVTSLVTFLVSLWVFSMFDSSNPDLQLEAKYPWIQVAGWNIYYYLAVDGLSILLVMLTAFLTPISILSTWSAVEDRVKDF